MLTMKKVPGLLLVFGLQSILAHGATSLLTPGNPCTDVCIVVGVKGTGLSALQHKLFQDLFKDYDKDAHPGCNATVLVTLGAKLARLVKVEEINNVVKAQWWMKQSWYNPDLRWNKSAYGNIGVIFVEPRRVWVPDILLYNNGDERVEAAGGVEKFKTKISITNKGIHSWFAPTIFTSMCKMDIRYFPFDEQFCHLQFGSWSYDSRMIDLQIDENETKIHKGVYQENNEWAIHALTSKKRLKHYPCCDYPYSDILVTIHMRRRSYHYLVNLVFPCAVIVSMVFCTFFLPAESGERISLCITVLMAMTIFQELTSEKLPASSEGFILIEMYYTACISAIALAILATCIVLNFYYTRTKMPQWLQRIFLGRLARLLGIKTRRNIKQKQELHQVITNSVISDESDIDGHNGVTLKAVNHHNTQHNDLPEEENIKPRNQANGAANGGLRKRRKSSIEPKKEVSVLCPNKVPLQSNNEEDWRTASHVLDRVSMVIGVVLAVVSTAGIFLQAPRVRNAIMGRESL